MVIAPFVLQYVSFQSTLPAGEATFIILLNSKNNKFQSTLPAGEATSACFTSNLSIAHFNPRFPRGKRQQLARKLNHLWGFQSTLPAGEATKSLTDARKEIGISIHASRGGSDFS